MPPGRHEDFSGDGTIDAAELGRSVPLADLRTIAEDVTGRPLEALRDDRLPGVD